MLLDIYNASQIFYDDYEYYCYKNCYLNVLNYYGINNAEYYIENSMDWKFSKVEENEDKFKYQFSTGDPYSSFHKPFDQSVRHLSKNELSVDQIWESNKKSLDQNIPVIAQVDVFYLKYTPYFKKKHSFHSLILAGYNELMKEVYVIDWYKPWYYKGSLSFEELHIARDSENERDGLFSGNPINYLYSEIDRNKWSTDIVDTRELICKSIQDNLDKYYLGKIEVNDYKGYYAIYEIAKLIEKNLVLDLEHRTKFLEDLHQKLYFIVTRKRLFQGYVEKINKDFPFIYVEPVKKQLLDSIQLWKILLSLIIKCSMSNDESLYENIISKMHDIIMKEKQFYYTLYEISKVIY